MVHKITIRKSVRQDTSDIIPSLIDKAIEWMQNKYPDVDFSRVEFIFSAGYCRSRYFRNELANAKYLAPNVCISTRATLMLYKKPSLGLKKYSLFTGSAIQMLCSLVHELTHHVQYERKVRIGNELDTTANEIEYLKDNYPDYYKKLVK